MPFLCKHYLIYPDTVHWDKYLYLHFPAEEPKTQKQLVQTIEPMWYELRLEVKSNPASKALLFTPWQTASKLWICHSSCCEGLTFLKNYFFLLSNVHHSSPSSTPCPLPSPLLEYSGIKRRTGFCYHLLKDIQLPCPLVSWWLLYTLMEISHFLLDTNLLISN